MGRSVIDDPKYPTGFFIGRSGHDLFHQSIKRSDSTFSFTSAKNLGLMDVQGGDIGPGATATIFVLHLHRRPGLTRIGPMLPLSGLNAGLLVSGENKFIGFKGSALPNSLIEIEDATGFVGKLRIAGKNPTTMFPGLNGIFMEPAPNGAAANRSHQAGLLSIVGQIGSTPPRQGGALDSGQLTGDRFNLYHQIWGEKTGDARAAVVLRARPSVVQRNVFATG